MNLLAFCLTAFGATQIIVYSKLIARPDQGWVGHFLNCPMCVGFHVGWILMLIPNSLFQFDSTIFNGFVLGCISSGTSYLLSMVISDDGIQLHMDNEVDASTSSAL